MRACIGLIALAAFAAQAQTPPPAFPPRNVQDTFFGTVVDDPYRDLEDARNPDVAAWAKRQAGYARGQLDSLPGYKALRARLAELDDSVAASIGSVKQDGQGRLFFTRRGAKDDTFKSIPTTGRKRPASRTPSTISRRRPTGSSSLSASPPRVRKKRPST